MTKPIYLEVSYITLDPIDPKKRNSKIQTYEINKGQTLSYGRGEPEHPVDIILNHQQISRRQGTFTLNTTPKGLELVIEETGSNSCNLTLSFSKTTKNEERRTQFAKTRKVILLPGEHIRLPPVQISQLSDPYYMIRVREKS